MPLYQVDAFADKVFSGNPAAVCLLNEWLSDEVMLSIASENNLSETAFVNINSNPIFIRWFTPTLEVDLCGHATLATARILFDEYLPKNTSEIIFNSRSGELKAFRRNGLIYLDFPRDEPKRIENNSLIVEGVGIQPKELFKGKDDFLAIFESEQVIRAMNPDFKKISGLKSRGLIVSAQGRHEDFVSRCFYPQTGVDEDSVTGSAHTLMVPYWQKILGKDVLTARQCSLRGGYLKCQLHQDRVLIGGSTVRFMEGKITLEDY
ncbi:MAG: PhzF family phenazine biosynthesis protein [Gammaproteobacteria bacterium]|nr:PhzF family phenazine biosynthesis protein [Gammaproteobacteria bacterium]